MCNFCCTFAAAKVFCRLKNMKKRILIIIGCVLLIGAAVGCAVWMYHEAKMRQQAAGKEQQEQEAQEMEFPEHETNSVIFFEEEVPPADPLMVGRWSSVENPGWHKVYYDDDDGEGRYWGKEWDESDDVMEEDLSYHGNGWFRWRKSNDTLIEFSTMDFRDVPIAHEYLVSISDSTNIAIAETNRRSVYKMRKE